MKLIIDGYNLIYSLNFKKSLKEKREKLISLLDEFKNLNKVDITVVFDGTNQESEHRGYENKNGIKIIFSASGETADDVIIDIIKKRKEKAGNFVIVSSDNKIINFATENFIRVIQSESFADYLV